MDAFVEAEMLIDSNQLIPFETQHCTTLSWSSKPGLSYQFGEYARIDHYRMIVDQRDFCFCFEDGGVVQVKYDISDGEIVSHRLCYFPCPFTFTPDERQELGLSDLALMLGGEELRTRSKLVSPIRFDYDAEFSDQRHAHAHLSINKDSCRVPAYGPVSLGHFFRFILRYFYETDFLGAANWDDIRPRLFVRTLRHPPPHELHVETAASY